MKFNSHKNKLIENIGIALKKDKEGIINDFKFILSDATNLLKTEQYAFWISQIGKFPIEEIPMTKYGYESACSTYRGMGEIDRNILADTLTSLCESLFTYSHEDEVCEMQSDFHFYYDLTHDVVFKESELGVIEPADITIVKDQYRIAFKSEIGAEDNEFL